MGYSNRYNRFYIYSENIKIEAKYSSTCDCGAVHTAHRKPKRTHWCKCKGRKFNPLDSLQYVQNF